MASFIKKWRKKAIAMYGKARGLTKAQRDKVTAAAHRRSSSKTSKRSKTKTTKKVKTRMGKKKGKGGGKSPTRTLFKLVRLGALVAPAIYDLARPVSTEEKIHALMVRYSGYDNKQNKWVPHRMLEGWGPYLGACLATYGIPKLVSIIRRL